MDTSTKIEKLSTCTNLGVIDKINELIDQLNVSNSIEIPVEGDSESIHCLIQNMSNFSCMLTIVTEDDSVLIFSVTNTTEKKEIKNIFIEATTNEFYSETPITLLNITENSDLILRYNKKCKVLIDGISGSYDAMYPDTELDLTTVVSSTGPTDWKLYTPFEIVKTEDSWITLTDTYNKDGKKYQYIIGFDETEVRSLITEVDERLSALIQGILEVIGDEDDVKSKGISSVSFENLSEYDVSPMYAVRVSLGETTYSFGTRDYIYYCDGYLYIGDGPIGLEIAGAAYNNLIQLPDYVNSYMDSEYGQKTFYKFTWDKTEVESLISDLNSQYQTDIELYEMQDESELLRNPISAEDPSQTIEPIVIELKTEKCNTIWANINDLYSKDEVTNDRIDNIDTEISSINQNITNINSSINTISNNVTTNTNNISNLTSRLDEIYKEGQTQGSHVGLLQDEIDRNNNQDTRLDELLTKTEDPTTHVITETGRVKNLESNVAGLSTDVEVLKRLKPYNVTMDLTKDYTCIAEVEYDVNNNVVTPFNVEYDVITKNNDELHFIVSESKVQLLNLTNNSYDFSSNIQNDDELVIVKLNNSTKRARVYLKKYDSQKDMVLITITNNIDCELKECPTDALDHSDLTSGTIKLIYDDDFFRNIDPLFTTPNNSGIIITESMEPINPSNSNSVNNPKSRKVDFDLDTGEVAFNNQQFDVVLDGQTGLTTVSIKDDAIVTEYKLQGVITNLTSTDFNIAVTKDGQSVDVHDLYLMAQAEKSIIIKISDANNGVLNNAIFRNARYYNLAELTEYVEFNYVNTNAVYIISCSYTSSSSSTVWSGIVKKICQYDLQVVSTPGTDTNIVYLW